MLVTGRRAALNVTYTDGARQWDKGFALLEEATKHLEKVAGPSADLVRADWERAEDTGGRAVYTLRLSEGTGKVEASFTLNELRSPSHMRYRLLRLWGDLLQIRSHRQLQEILSGGQEGE
jgi:hypothetical protein